MDKHKDENLDSPMDLERLSQEIESSPRLSSRNSSKLRDSLLSSSILASPRTTTASLASKNSTIVLSSICIFGYLGVATRILLNSLWLYSLKSSPELMKIGSGYLLSNIVGCLVMGFMRRLAIVRNSSKCNFLLIGITVGFCGCCSTFSSWNDIMSHYIAADQKMVALFILVLQMATAFCSMRIGYDSAESILEIILRKKKTLPRGMFSDHDQLISLLTNAESLLSRMKLDLDIQTNVDNLVEDIKIVRSTFNTIKTREKKDLAKSMQFLKIGILLCALCITMIVWLLAFFDPNHSRRNFWIAVCFAPFGALVRYGLSKFNYLLPNFPLFTLIANVVASVLGHIIDIINLRSMNDSSTTFTFWGMNGVKIGFCGSLSTVSSFMNELFNLDQKHYTLAYRYVFVSIFLTQTLLGVIQAIDFSV